MSQPSGSVTRACGPNHERSARNEPFDIFSWIDVQQDEDGADGTVLAEIRDLRRYLLLVESEMVARGVVKTVTAYRAVDPASAVEIRRVPGTAVPVHAVGDPPPVPVEDSNRHADRAPPRPLSRAPLRPHLNRVEYNNLPVGEEREAYEWSEEHGEWRLKP